MFLFSDRYHISRRTSSQDLHNHVISFEPVYLGTAVTALRDGLIQRFERAYTWLKMGVALDLEEAPFSHKVYPVATVLDPNMVLYWVRVLES